MIGDVIVRPLSDQQMLPQVLQQYKANIPCFIILESRSQVR